MKPRGRIGVSYEKYTTRAFQICNTEFKNINTIKSSGLGQFKTHTKMTNSLQRDGRCGGNCGGNCGGPWSMIVLKPTVKRSVENTGVEFDVDVRRGSPYNCANHQHTQ